MNKRHSKDTKEFHWNLTSSGGLKICDRGLPWTLLLSLDVIPRIARIQEEREILAAQLDPEFLA